MRPDRQSEQQMGLTRPATLADLLYGLQGCMDHDMFERLYSLTGTCCCHATESVLQTLA